MALVERVTQQDLVLYEVLKNPVLCAEFLNNLDLDEHTEAFELTEYQKEFICDFNSYVSIRAGRAVGKTEGISCIIIWALIFNLFPRNYIVYTVPNKVHLDPVFSNLTRKLRTNSFLKHFIEPKSGINGQDNTIKLLNDAILLCRIAGTTGGGANVVGLHSPFEIVDESGFYPMGTFTELSPTLNAWTSGYRQIVSGVPTGLRENNVCYFADAISSTHTKHRISCFQNPRYTEEMQQRDMDQYNGPDGDDYIHLVLGEHGKPVFSIFDRASFEISNYPVYKMTLNGLELKDNLQEYIERLAAFPVVDNTAYPVLMGIDLGYTDPTAIVILQQKANGKMYFHGRIKLQKVSYPVQEKIIDILDRKFNPVLIGIDVGNAGKAVLQHLLEDNEYLHKNFKKRLIPIDFSSHTITGINLDGEEIKSKTKPLAVSVLQEYSNSHRIVYTSTDLEMVVELERMTYTKSVTGDITYKTLTERGGKRGEDHFTAALLCITLSYYIQNESLSKQTRKRLIRPTWFTG